MGSGKKREEKRESKEEESGHKVKLNLGYRNPYQTEEPE